MVRPHEDFGEEGGGLNTTFIRSISLSKLLMRTLMIFSRRTGLKSLLSKFLMLRPHHDASKTIPHKCPREFC